jgi:hypothetical protein
VTTDDADLLSEHADVLPVGTSDAWVRLSTALPAQAYLAGGTALAIHLRHRVSMDLDFFTEAPFDAGAYARVLASRFGDFVATRIDDGTVNGLLGAIKVQFLDASTQKNLVGPALLAGVRVASTEDILAMKLQVILDRGELRDYFDLMCIENQTDLDAVVGVRLYLDRYSPAVPDQHVYQIVTSIGFLEDVEEDPGLPMSKKEIAAYWADRQPQIARALRIG